MVLWVTRSYAISEVLNEANACYLLLGRQICQSAFDPIDTGQQCAPCEP